MKSLFTIICWLGIFAIGAQLRLDDLATRPFHADEATGAKITSIRLEQGSYAFDPIHYHGPTLSQLGALSARTAGETKWSELTKQPLRLVPAVTGCLLVLLPLMGRKRFGDTPMLLAALALATSPILVYYSRMYIHEILLAFFGVLALFQLAARKCWWPTGIWIGLMFATKETFAISMIAWSGAGVATYLIARDRPDLKTALTTIWKPLLIVGGLALLVSMFFYTNYFTRWSGAVDAFRTYFIYDTVDDHDKPFTYYLTLLISPQHSGGLWWFETTIAIAAFAAVIGSFTSRSMSRASRSSIHFLTFAAIFHLLIYSLISYKTPWLMLLPWAHVCLLAGFAVTMVPTDRPRITGLVAAVIALAMVPQWILSRYATGRYASDDRNPYAYVPTAGDIESIDEWLGSIASASPATPLQPIAVIGTEYWPLPWYLRKHPQVGVWSEAPESLERLPVVFALVDLTDTLATTHVPIPRGLRTDTPMIVWIRNDFWDASIAVDEP
ncbi:flippase activity-associated protein Agl23 [Haloferula sp.]|uniref:flippase activity-associated protein Agl23 n=1 Tax=Haloferula sp. TaxID=2497595 RepID=UPI00329DCAA7